MLTRAGWTVTALAVLAIVSGRLVGSVELFVVGSVAAMVVAVAGIHVVTTRTNLSATRTVQPSRVYAGDMAVVELSITNHGHRRSPPAVVIDSVDQQRQARVRVAPLSSQQRTSGRYQLATDRRGRLRLGPLRVQYSDPLGLARIDVDIGTTDHLLVFPAIEDLVAPPMDAHGTPDTGTPQRQRWTDGDEFHALRGYATGDDLRRVHWPTSARVDELMIRQHDQRSQARTTVVLDTRSGSHTPESFEQCVSAAASVMVAAARRGDWVSLATTVATSSAPASTGTPRRHATTGTGTGTGAGKGAGAGPGPGSSSTSRATPGDIDNLLDQLTDIHPSSRPEPGGGAPHRAGNSVTVDVSGVVVVVTTTTGAADIHHLLHTHAATRHPNGVLVLFAGPGDDGRNQQRHRADNISTPPLRDAFDFLDASGTSGTPDASGASPAPGADIAPGTSMTWPIVAVTDTGELAKVWTAWATSRRPYASSALLAASPSSAASRSRATPNPPAEPNAMPRGQR